MQVFKHIFLTMLFALASLTISAYDFEVEGIYYNITSQQDLTCEVTYKDQSYQYYSGDVIIPESVTHEGRTFSVTNIGYSAFNLSPALSSIEIPSSITNIGTMAFLYCTGLKKIKIPDSVSNIEGWAFGFCTSLTNIEIPESVSKIGDLAFGYCDNLTSITIGKNVALVGWQAFSNCTKLEEIISLNPTPPSAYDNSFQDVPKTTCVLKVPYGSVEAYKSAQCWKAFGNIVPLPMDTSEKCSTPFIRIVDRKLMFESSTPGAKHIYSISCDDSMTLAESVDGYVDLAGAYQISVYAYAEGYENSETVTATLIWVNSQIQEEEDPTAISMPTKKAVVISAREGAIRVSGTEKGEIVEVYTVDGTLMKKVVAEDGETVVECPSGVNVVKIGNRTVKINVK